MLCSLVLNEFLKFQELKNNSDETIIYYKQRIGYFIDFVNDKDIRKVNVKDYDNYLFYLKNKDISDATVKTSLTAVRVFLNYCYKEHYIKKDIVSSLSTFKAGKKTIVVLSEMQIQDIYSSYDENSFYGSRNLLMISFMLDCGLRLSEMLNLTINDVQTELHLVKVRGKGNKERLVPLSDVTLYYFYNYLGIKTDINNFLFIDINGKHITTSAVRKELHNLKIKLGFSTLYPHYLRHTFATYYIVYGGNPLTLKSILGHTTLYITELYVHIADQLTIAKNIKYTPLSNIPYFQEKRR